MSIGYSILKIVNKKYEPNTKVEKAFRGNDMAFLTDAEGNPVTLFIGKRRLDGTIKGERYSRVLKTDLSGNIIKDHWDLKGKV